jgi:hypothetical protein
MDSLNRVIEVHPLAISHDDVAGSYHQKEER